MEGMEGGKKDNVAEPNPTSDDGPQLEMPIVPVQPAESESSKYHTEKVLDQPSTQDLRVTEKDVTDHTCAAFGSSYSDSDIDSQVQTDPSSGRSLLRPLKSKLVRSAFLEPEESTSGKKIVHFADTLGLDLAEVKRFKPSKVPDIPSSAYLDLKLELPEDLSVPSSTEGDGGETKLVFVPQFLQPGSDPQFMKKLEEQKVCLENVIVSDVSVTGYIRTLNMGFEKLVQVRYTTDKWSSYEDMNAHYLPSSSDGFSDKFFFQINLPNTLLNEKLIFSIRYVVTGEEFWDNNYSQDFVIKCVAQKV